MSDDRKLNEVIRVRKRPSGFVTMDKGFLENAALSWKAKGILAYLLSKPDNWKVIVGDVVKRAADGKASVYSGLTELRNCGYYLKNAVRTPDGRRIAYWESTVYELPQAANPNVEPFSLFIDFQEIENQEIDNQDIENRTLIRINNSNNDLSKNEVSPVRWAGRAKYEQDLTGQDLNVHILTIKANIDYDDLITGRPSDAGLIDEIVAVIVDAIMTKGETVRIDGEDKPREIVRQRLMELGYHDIELVVGQYRSLSEPIKRKRQYILTMLYNAKLEIEAHYINQVNVHFAGEDDKE